MLTYIFAEPKSGSLTNRDILIPVINPCHYNAITLHWLKGSPCSDRPFADGVNWLLGSMKSLATTFLASFLCQDPKKGENTPLQVSASTALFHSDNPTKPQYITGIWITSSEDLWSVNKKMEKKRKCLILLQGICYGVSSTGKCLVIRSHSGLICIIKGSFNNSLEKIRAELKGNFEASGLKLS